MKNLPKRILTSLIIFPLSIFFIIEGGNLLLSYLLLIFFVSNYELLSVFNNKITILFLDIILILALFSIYELRHISDFSFVILIWAIILCIFSDVGGYVFGKIFKWRKLTTISPNKTLSGVIGSFIFSLFSLFVMNHLIYKTGYYDLVDFFEAKYFFFAIIFSLIAQVGDLTISFCKRSEDIKDTGKVLPGHGGIFDRIDSLMFVVILAFVLYRLDLLTNY